MSMSDSMISVIIPTYNYELFIEDAIKSVLKQTYKNVEIIVVDDGSTDNTREVILERYGDKVQYVYQENNGASSARNMGIKKAKGEYIAFLDADDMWLPQKLERQVIIISESRLIGLVSCGTYAIDVCGEIVWQCIRKNYGNRNELMRDLVIKNVITGGCSGALVRRECFEKLGLFDEELRCGEDWDMWLRIAKHYEIIFVEAPLVKIRLSGGSMSSPINAHKTLRDELKVLHKTFSSASFERKWILRRKAYSYCYFCSAWALNEIGKKEQAIYYFLKSILLFPLNISLLEGPRYGLIVRILLGNQKYRNLTNLIRRKMKKKQFQKVSEHSKLGNI